MRILLIEDDPVVAQSIALMLSPEPKLADASSSHEFIETVWGRGYALWEPGTQKIAM